MIAFDSQIDVIILPVGLDLVATLVGLSILLLEWREAKERVDQLCVVGFHDDR